MWHKLWLANFYTFVFGLCFKCNALANGSGLVHVQTFTGEIGATNFTYYKLTLEGHVVVTLQTLEGDADLYLSTETLKPTWEDYTMKSDTCSSDVVVVQEFHDRPVGIGVYGYIHWPLSTFRLSVYIDESRQSYYPEERKSRNSVGDTTHGFKDPMQTGQTVPDEEEEESLLWSLFLGFLKVLLDILI
uniref:UPF0669 protein C6orf120 homolog n=1 Tax=Phallusia mammillata TaxID=59560 RepID=A0A6F9D8N1_9ASCI|nr:UPF0669 protein C6orf120 homolog [Phallusia mammillata]